MGVVDVARRRVGWVEGGLERSPTTSTTAVAIDVDAADSLSPACPTRRRRRQEEEEEEEGGRRRRRKGGGGGGGRREEEEEEEEENCCTSVSHNTPLSHTRLYHSIYTIMDTSQCQLSTVHHGNFVLTTFASPTTTSVSFTSNTCSVGPPTTTATRTTTTRINSRSGGARGLLVV